MPFCDFTLAAPKKYFFFTIHSLNLCKKENLCFENILFVNYWSVITKYPFLTLSCVLKGRRARWECLFWAFIVWREARLQKTWSCVRGKKIHERWIFPFSSPCHMGAPSLAIPSEAPKSRRTILMPVQGKSMKSISLISNQKYTPKLSTTLHKIRKTWPWGVIVQPLGTET